MIIGDCGIFAGTEFVARFVVRVGVEEGVEGVIL